MDFCWHLAHIERLQGLVETNCILIGTLLDINLKILCTSALCNAPVLSHPNMWHRGVGNMERGSHLSAVKALWLFASRLFDWEGLCEAHSDAWNMKNTSLRQAFRGCSFKCMCNSQAISDLLPSAVPRTLQIANGSNQETKEKHMFQASLLRCVQLKNKCFGNLMCWFYLVLRGCPSFCRWEDLRDWQLCGSGVAFGENEDEIERNSHWKWCSDIGIIFKSFSISTSILKVVQPSPKVKIGFSGTGPWSFAEEFLPSRTHGSPCGAMPSWTWMESMCWKMTFLFF